MNESQACCAHLYVVYVTKEITPSNFIGWWECEDCKHKFVPFSHVFNIQTEAQRQGWNNCLRNIKGALEGYPNHGGDIEVMKAVDKLIQESNFEFKESVKKLLKILDEEIGFLSLNVNNAVEEIEKNLRIIR